MNHTTSPRVDSDVVYGYEFFGRVAEELRLEDGLLDTRLGKSPVFQAANPPGVIERIEAVRNRLRDPVDRLPLVRIAGENMGDTE